MATHDQLASTLIKFAGQEKKYSQDHEWIEVGADGKTGMFPFKGPARGCI
jgi:hypothetical protein